MTTDEVLMIFYNFSEFSKYFANTTGVPVPCFSKVENLESIQIIILTYWQSLSLFEKIVSHYM